MKIRNPRFDFVDLFAGIGGIRMAFEDAGGRCVMTSEWDARARKTYRAFFPEHEELPNHFDNEDITEAPLDEIPEHDVLAGGFPCQPFSVAGVSKKNAMGRPHGFDDPTQGTLFFNIKAILKAKRPKAFLLENVKNLLSHDKGNTWKVIHDSLVGIGYLIDKKVLDAKLVVPQHRERTFIVGFDREYFDLHEEEEYDWTVFWNEVRIRIDHESAAQKRQYCVPDGGTWPQVGFILQNATEVDDRYTLTPRLWKYLNDYRDKHQAQGNGFGFGLIRPDSEYTRTISARYYKDGSEVLIDQGSGKPPRRLTPLECARLQGFPVRCHRFFNGELKQPVSDTAAYKQFGNSVCVPVVRAIARVLTDYLMDDKKLGDLAVRPQQIQLALSG